MELSDLRKRKLPDAPGVYFFLGVRKEILYIGKATSLKSRVRSYFDTSLSEKRSPLIDTMVKEAKTVSFTVTDSVLEAVLLETNLIRTHKPRYNTRSKDDKSYNHLVITSEEFPRILVVRGKDLVENDARYTHVFGPFPSVSILKDALKILRKLFQFYDGQTQSVKGRLARGTINFNTQIGLYPSGITKREYAKTIKHIRFFFEGKKAAVIRDLEREMNRYAKREEFEKAGECKRKIFALRHIQDISLVKRELRVYRDDRTFRIEAYDVAHFGGADMVGVMTVLEAGKPMHREYRKFSIRSCEGSNDPKALREVIERRLRHTEWVYPELIVVDGSTAQKNAAEHTLTKAGLLIPVVGVVKDEHHRPKRIIGPQKIISEHEHSILKANAEAHRFAVSFHRQKRRSKLV